MRFATRIMNQTGRFDVEMPWERRKRGRYVRRTTAPKRDREAHEAGPALWARLIKPRRR